MIRRGARNLARCVAGICTLLALAILPGFARPVQAHPSNSHWFWVEAGVAPSHVRATLLASDRGVHLFAAASSHVSPRVARSIVTSVVRHILPIDLRTFGTPRHFHGFTILMVPLGGATLGYFDENDVLPDAPSYSNHQNILYVRPPASMPDPDGITDSREVIAHELQHLIEFRIRVIDRHEDRQADWLNEGLSFYAQMRTGFWTERDVLKVQAAAADPSWPVTSLDKTAPNFPQSARTAYGRAGLFVSYLAERFGPSTPGDLVSTPESGMLGIDHILRTRPHPATVQTAFADWGVAALIDAAGRFGYGQLRWVLRATPQTVHTQVTPDPTSLSLALHPWAQQYIRLSLPPHGLLSLRLDAPPGHLRAALVETDDSHLAEPIVRWFSPDARGSARLDIPIDAHWTQYVVLNDVADPAVSHPATGDRVSLETWVSPDHLSPPGRPRRGTDER